MKTILPGARCGCGKRVVTPFCPHCGRALDDAPGQMICDLEKRILQNRKRAEAADEQARAWSKGNPADARDQAHLVRAQNEAACFRGTVRLQESWLAWLKEHQHCAGAKKRGKSC